MVQHVYVTVVILVVVVRQLLREILQCHHVLVVLVHYVYQPTAQHVFRLTVLLVLRVFRVVVVVVAVLPT